MPQVPCTPAHSMCSTNMKCTCTYQRMLSTCSHKAQLGIRIELKWEPKVSDILRGTCQDNRMEMTNLNESLT